MGNYRKCTKHFRLINEWHSSRYSICSTQYTTETHFLLGLALTQEKRYQTWAGRFLEIT